jgi:tRNA uridine 5-carboxymethylaminomethyl modification enzyme
LESVEFIRPGYAVEYDTIDPTDLHFSFMSKFQEGLFFAGQVNRTSGYEEAATQGMWAGINAALYLQEKDFVYPNRSRSYTETLVDDLTSKGTQEPYRMFTSRSEYRLVLREDNAQERLFDLGVELGLLTEKQKIHHSKNLEEIAKGRAFLENNRIRVSKDRVQSYMEYLKRPEISWESFSVPEASFISDKAVEKLEVEAKYDGYLSRQESEISALQKLSSSLLDPSFNIEELSSLSIEVIEKYKAIKPKSVLELSKISGIPPTAVLMIARAAGRSKIRPENMGECFT